MLVEPAVLVQYLGPILFLTFVVVVGQIFYATLGFLAAGQDLKVAIQSSFSLAQIGEFAFIIASLGLTMGVTSSFLYPVAVAVSVVTDLHHSVHHPAQRAGLPLARPDHARACEEPAQALRRRYADRQHRARVDEVLEEVAAQYRALLDSAGGRRLDLFELLHPWIESRFEGFWGKLIATTTTVLVMAPLLWALALRHLSKRLFVPLWNDPRFNHGLIVTLVAAADSRRADVPDDGRGSFEHFPVRLADYVRSGAAVADSVLEADQTAVPAFREAVLRQSEREGTQHGRPCRPIRRRSICIWPG